MKIDFKIDYVTPAELAATLAETAAIEAMNKYLARNDGFYSCTVWAKPRVPADAPAHKYPGWLEWVIDLKHESGRGIYVGMIQRRPGEAFEFHS